MIERWLAAWQSTEDKMTSPLADRGSPHQREHSLSVSDWITPGGHAPDDESARRRGHHRLQIAIDTIAYAHNIPLRLLLPDRLRNLREVIAKLLENPAVIALLRGQDEIATTDWSFLASQEQLEQGTDWILGLPQDVPPSTAEPEPRWLTGMLILLPYLERQIWLTEMGNPLPAHALCRMHDHWALFILLWSWRHSERFRPGDEHTANALDIEGLEARTLDSHPIRWPDGSERQCVLVVGPYFVAPDAPESGVFARHLAYCNRFSRFVKNIMSAREGTDSGLDSVPLRDELLDALGSRIALTQAEAALRSRTALRSLKYLLAARIGDVGFVDSMARQDWEVVSGLASWLARWDDALAPHLEIDSDFLLDHGSDPAGILVRKLPAPSGPGEPAFLFSLSLTSCVHPREGLLDVSRLLRRVDEHNRRRDPAQGSDADAFRIDRPMRYFGRIRERQNSMWSSQVIAINNLLSRHGPLDIYIGADEFSPHDAEGRSKIDIDASLHLLRGFGNRICRYLISMTRADAAAISWLDYAQEPPRLLLAGEYSRHASHRAAGAQEIWEQFDRWAWAPGAEPSNDCQANRRAESMSQGYRVAATCLEDPPPIEAAHANNDPSVAPRRKRVVAARKEWTDGNPDPDSVTANFKAYPDPKPQDGLAAPLLVNGRVIGVVTLLGSVQGQFEPRMFWPLRRAANLAAACMNHESQVWHMRRLNYLFASRGLTQFQDRRGNPLRDVSRCLANIFLCPAVHIWLQSPSNEDRFELLGYNWEGLFRFPQFEDTFAREFLYQSNQDPGDEPENRAFRPFSCMAIDIARSRAPDVNPLGKFVQGYFDKDLAKTADYAAAAAGARGVRLGQDFYEARNEHDGEAARQSRQRIFGSKESGGFRLLDIMSFALLLPDAGGWRTVGVVTLHDKGDALRDPLRRCQPWDRGWSPVVAHIQTYLPYLLRQAEVLNNPEVDARRYLIHAGRAELMAVTRNTERMRKKLESALAPGRGVRQMMDKVLGSGYASDYRDDLRPAQAIMTDAWEAVVLASSRNSERNLRLLANVMHEYRNMSGLPGAALTAVGERFRLLPVLEESIGLFAHEFRHRRSRRIEVPETLEVLVPLQWLRIVMRDLIHNAAKYATGDSFIVAWEQQTRTLSLVNEGPYRSDTDIREKLLAPGGQGSAGLALRDSTKDRLRYGDNRGHGLGLWGAKLLCDVMDIDFNVDIRPMSATLKSSDGRIQVGHARYVFKLGFAADTIVSTTGAARGQHR